MNRSCSCSILKKSNIAVSLLGKPMVCINVRKILSSIEQLIEIQQYLIHKYLPVEEFRVH